MSFGVFAGFELGAAPSIDYAVDCTNAAAGNGRDTPSRPSRSPMFGPPGLGRLAQRSASLFRTHVTPTRSAETNRRSLDRCRREPATCDVEQFDREIEQDFWRQARLPHHA